MGIDNEQKLRRIEDCRKLYLKYKGQHHELIEAEMRGLGYTDFHRRCLYRRFERGRLTVGWIERFGWAEELRNAKRDAGNAPSPLHAGNAGALACTDAASASGAKTDRHTSPDNLEVDIARPPHAGGTGVAARGACVPGKEAGGPGDDPPEQPKQYDRTAAENDFTDFQTWLKQVSPTMNWTWRHQVYIYKRLQRVTDGLCKRLMLFLPPRHGKSELVTVRYAAWRIKQDPKLNIIVGSYNQKLASKFSRKIRRVLTEDAYRGSAAVMCGKAEPFRQPVNNVMAAMPPTAGAARRQDGADDGKAQPFHTALGQSPAETGGSDFRFAYRPTNSEAEWETCEGGGVRAVGVGAGVTGYGAGLIIVDDPVRGRAAAESETFREKVWDWFNDDLYTRLARTVRSSSSRPAGTKTTSPAAC